MYNSRLIANPDNPIPVGDRKSFYSDSCKFDILAEKYLSEIKNKHE